MMTVREFMNLLEKVENKDRIVIIQKDAEGNGYSPAAGVDESFYTALTTWSGEVDDDETNEQPCVVVFPVN